MADLDAARRLAQEQALEYGQFEAIQPIHYDGALAYAPGHPVPASNVELHGYEVGVQVRRVASKTEAKKAADAVSTETKG